MCKERRPTFEVTDMSGVAPKKTVSFNLSTVELYKSVAAIVGTMFTIAALFFGLSYNFMMYTADRNFVLRVHESLQPGGDIAEAILQAEERGNHALEKRLIRIETILLEMRDE